MKAMDQWSKAILEGGKPSMKDARHWLEKAIARHRRHMNGTEATDDASQQAMMDEMEKALAALETP